MQNNYSAYLAGESELNLNTLFVETCTSDKQAKEMSHEENEAINESKSLDGHVPEIPASEVDDSLMKCNVGSYLMAVRGLFRNV